MHVDEENKHGCNISPMLKRSKVPCLWQVWRWSQQYHAQLSGPAMPEMIKLHKWLQANIPAADADESQTRISHGDFKYADE